MATYDLTSTIPSKIKTGDILNCPYSGSAKSITLPKGQYKLECWGAQGGNYGSNQGGHGGYSAGILTLSNKTIIYLQTGGKGSDSSVNGGYNGGGKGISQGRGGGGASDIRIGQNSLYARVIVAGAGGGSGVAYDCSGKGAGGGTSGLDGYSNGVTSSGGNRSGSGGSQTAGGISMSSIASTKGSFGQGGPAYQYSCGGGGGGWYGGGGAYDNDSDSDGRNGGGGSGYIYTSSTASNYPSGCLLNSSYYLTNAQTIAGNTAFASPTGASETGHAGNGYIRITVIEASSGNTLVKIPQTLPSAYSPIEYLQFTGSQYIDTGAIVDSNTGFDITFEVLNGQSGSPYYNLFGVRGNDSSGGTGETQNFFRIDTIAVDNNSGTEFKYGSTVYNSGIKNTSKINIKLLNKVYTKPDGSTITVAGTITSGLSMYIGCINKAGAAYGNKASLKIYRFKIYNGSTLTNDYVPAQRVSDKVLGLYDIKKNVFKTEAAGGTFTSNLMNDPSSLVYFNGDSLESQGNVSLTITNNNVSLSDEQMHFGKKSLKFDGSSSYMYMPFPSTYTGDITIEGWFYQTSNNNTNYPTPFTLISSAGRGMYMHRLSSQTFVAATPSNSWPGLSGGTTALNTWTHIAMCLSGTTTYCFLDGKLKGTLTNTNTSYVGLTLGTLASSASDNHSSGCCYKGYIAELKVTKGCKWTKDFTLPTGCYGTAIGPWKKQKNSFIKIASTSSIPSGLVELEYIKPNGTQYINTQFIPTGNTRVIFTFEPTVADNQALYTGGRTAASGTDAKTFSAFYISKAIRRDYYGTSKTTTTTYDINTKITVDANKNTTLINNSSALTDFTLNTSTTSIMPIILFIAANQTSSTSAIQTSSSGAQYKFYSCKIYDNGKLARDFIPAKRISDGKCGLWDKTYSKFYIDINGNNFTAGPIKGSIEFLGKALDYIQSDGAEIIDTGFKPNQDTRICGEAQFLDNSGEVMPLFGYRVGTTSQRYELFAYNKLIYSPYNTTAGSTTTLTQDKFSFDKNKNITTINGTTISTITYANFTCGGNLTLFGYNDNNSSTNTKGNKRLYWLKIYDNGKLIRDFIPCQLNGNNGLWDQLNKVFYEDQVQASIFNRGELVSINPWRKITNMWIKNNQYSWKQI